MTIDKAIQDKIAKARKDERERVIKRLATYVRTTDYNWLAMGNSQLRLLFRQALKSGETEE